MCVIPDVARAAHLRENLGMLVWIPNSCLNQTQCKKWLIDLRTWCTDESLMAFCVCFFFFFSVAVDEYIAIAKEKHGYNMEQVIVHNLVTFFYFNSSCAAIFRRWFTLPSSVSNRCTYEHSVILEVQSLLIMWCCPFLSPLWLPAPSPRWTAVGEGLGEKNV